MTQEAELFQHWEPGEEPAWVHGPGAVERATSRAIVLDHDGRLLLLKWLRPDGVVVWITPGGAVEPGESREEAARREIWEETGLTDYNLGPEIWGSENYFAVGATPYRSIHHYFLVRVGSVVVSNVNMDAHERDVNGEHAWWTLAELRESDQVRPPGLVDVVSRILAGAD